MGALLVSTVGACLSGKRAVVHHPLKKGASVINANNNVRPMAVAA